MASILVTGASGFVGSRFLRRWRGSFDIMAPSHSELDVTDEGSVRRFFDMYRPQTVLHLAAISNTWYCENNPDESLRVNVLAAERLAKAAAAVGARFVFFSSDQVYNGCLDGGLLCEDVPVAPENHYGRHKLQAERFVLDAAPDSVLLRATWMYDNAVQGLPVHDNFVLNIHRAVEQRTPIAFPVRECRGITWVGDVVEFLPYTFSLPGGVYNYGAENSLNTYETACCYFEMLDCGLRCDEIILPDTTRYPQHERNLAMSGEKIFRASGGAVCFCDTLTGLRAWRTTT